MKRLLLLLGSIALVLCVGEAAGRVRWASRFERPALAAHLPRLSRADLSRPGIRGSFKGNLYRTNRAGLRGPEYAASPKRGVYRIAVTGDSVAVGSGVEEVDRYSDALGRLLNEDAVNTRFEVINTALGGININWAIDRLEHAGAYYRFNLAVYGWTLNDIEGPAYKKLDGSESWDRYWTETQRFRASPSYLVRDLWPRWVAVRERFWPRYGDQFREVRSNYFDNAAAWAEFESGLDRLSRFARERGICAHVFIHTHLTTLGPAHPLRDVYDRVARAAGDRGLSVTESLPVFLGWDEEDLWVSPNDVHPNARGHELLARSLRDGLLGELPPTCWQTGFRN